MASLYYTAARFAATLFEGFAVCPAATSGCFPAELALYPPWNLPPSRAMRLSAPRCQRPQQKGRRAIGDASFVQRTQNDSEKRAGIPHECGVASWHKTVPRGTAKRAGGRAKTWGVWGDIPPTCKSPPHRKRACEGTAHATRRAWRSTCTSMHNVGWAGKMIGGCGGIFPPHAKTPHMQA